MPTGKFLDLDGLTHLWATIVNRLSGKADAANLETLEDYVTTVESGAITALSGVTATTSNLKKVGRTGSFQFVFKLDTALATSAQVDIATIPDGFRPIHYFYAFCTSANYAPFYGMVATGGPITIRNNSGVSIPANTTLYLSGTYIVA